MQTPESPSLASDYDLDAMMDALIQGRAAWVSAVTQPAADAGLAKAQLMMGILFQLGAGVSQSGLQAVRYYRLAAAQDDVLAWRNLGTLYLLGLAGIEIDKTEAHRCFACANLLETRAKANGMLAVEVVQ